MPPARLLIVDDHALMRETTQVMLEGEPDLEVVGEAVNGRHALDLCRQLRPDVVLMDVRMPEMDGLTATRAIKKEMPAISVLDRANAPARKVRSPTVRAPANVRESMYT